MPLDVGKIQAYREGRLNAPGKPDYTLPPGSLNARDIWPDGAPPSPLSSPDGPELNSDFDSTQIADESAPSSDPQVGQLAVAAPAPKRRGWVGAFVTAVSVAVLIIGAAAAFMRFR